MENQKEKINCLFYGRKSSESEDKQILSIESQENNMKKIAEKRGIKLIEPYLTESKSAKKPGRSVFNEMLKRINSGEANAIICWKLDRLARNFVDGGMIIDMLQRGVIQMIITVDRIWLPNDNVLPMSVEFGMANQYSRDLSLNVKRGQREKRERGIISGPAKIGYINEYYGKTGKKKVLVDPERFPLIKKLFEEYLTGQYSVRQLHQYAKDELGLKTIQREKLGGKPVSASYMPILLRDPFYAGFFYGRNMDNEIVRYEVDPNLPRIITEEEHYKIINMIGGKRKCPSINKHIFPYTGKIVCGNCGGQVTAEHKYQLICPECKSKFSYRNKTHCPTCNTRITTMENPKYLHYIYYHCTRNKDPHCKEKSVHQEHIDNYLADYFEENLEISPDLKEWALKHIAELNEKEEKNEFEIRYSWEKDLAKKKKEYQELVKMRIRKDIDEEDFLELKKSLKEEIADIEKRLNKKKKHKDPMEKAREIFDLAVGISEIFKNGEYKDKVKTLTNLESNLVLKNKELNIDTEKVYSILMNGIVETKKENPAFEPNNWPINKGKTEVLPSECPTWLPLLNVFRNFDWDKISAELKLFSFSQNF